MRNFNLSYGASGKSFNKSRKLKLEICSNSSKKTQTVFLEEVTIE
jgi:hypothetical protein